VIAYHENKTNINHILRFQAKKRLVHKLPWYPFP